MTLTDDKLKTDTAAWLHCFVTDKFPKGLPDKISEDIQHLILDAYIDGIRYGQDITEQARERGRIIISGR